MNSSKSQGRYWRHFLSTPFIYGVFFPVVVLDVCMEIFHRVCFPLYGIPIVKRGEYIKIDRHKLQYLSLQQKFQCIYCGYVNGYLAYATEIAARTEVYWCGIQHEKTPEFQAPLHHENFPKYGDEEEYRKKYLEE